MVLAIGILARQGVRNAEFRRSIEAMSTAIRWRGQRRMTMSYSNLLPAYRGREVPRSRSPLPILSDSAPSRLF